MLTFLSRRFMSLKLNQKLLLSYLFIILLIIVSVTIFVTNIYMNNWFEEQRNQYAVITDLAMNNFNTQIKEYENHIFTYFVNSEIAALYTGDQSVSKQYRSSVIASELDFLLYRIHNLASAAYMDRDGNVFTANKDHFSGSDEDIRHILKDVPIPQEDTPGYCYWLNINGQTYLKRDIYIFNPVISYIGTVVLAVDDQFIQKSIPKTDGVDGRIVVLNNKLEFVMGSDPAMSYDIITQHSRIVTGADGDDGTIHYDGEEYLISSVPSADKSWYIVLIIPMATLKSNLQLTLWSIYIIAIVASLLAIAVALFISRRIYQSIGGLMEGIKRMKSGDFESRIEVITEDEIGIVSQSFNDMAGRINDLVSQLVREELEKEQMQHQMLSIKYNALQSQINPHFMYNALDTISSLAKLSEGEAVSNLIVRFSRLLRRNIEIQNKFISIDEEIDYIHDFLFIYRSINSKRLEYNIYVEENIGHVLVPSLVLQPIVENAVKHNINWVDHLFVSVRIYLNQNDLILEVEDTGKGFYPAVREKLMACQQSPGATVDLGLNNTIRRLKLLYKDKAELSIMSESGKGSLLRITIKGIRY